MSILQPEVTLKDMSHVKLMSLSYPAWAVHQLPSIAMLLAGTVTLNPSLVKNKSHSLEYLNQLHHLQKHQPKLMMTMMILTSLEMTMKKRKKRKKRRESRKKDWQPTMQRKQPSKLSLPNHHCFLMSNLGTMKQIWARWRNWFVQFNVMDLFGVKVSWCHLHLESRNCRLVL